jgi:hypothetical protein
MNDIFININGDNGDNVSTTRSGCAETVSCQKKRLAERSSFGPHYTFNYALAAYEKIIKDLLDMIFKSKSKLWESKKLIQFLDIKGTMTEAALLNFGATSADAEDTILKESGVYKLKDNLVKEDSSIAFKAGTYVGLCIRIDKALTDDGVLVNVPQILGESSQLDGYYLSNLNATIVQGRLTFLPFVNESNTLEVGEIFEFVARNTLNKFISAFIGKPQDTDAILTTSSDEASIIKDLITSGKVTDKQWQDAKIAYDRFVTDFDRLKMFATFGMGSAQFAQLASNAFKPFLDIFRS